MTASAPARCRCGLCFLAAVSAPPRGWSTVPDRR